MRMSEMNIELRRVPEKGVEVWYPSGSVMLPLVDASGDPVRFSKEDLYRLYHDMDAGELGRALYMLSPQGGTITYKG